MSDGVKEGLLLLALFLGMVAVGTLMIGALVWVTLHGLLA